MRPLNPAPAEDQKPAYPQLIFYGEPSASLSLYLDGLPPDLAAAIAVLPPRRMAADFLTLAGAGLVIFVRGFETVWRSGLLTALANTGVPCAWFTDDDFTALRGEQPGFSFYSPQHMRAFAGHMVALIGTTPALCQNLAAYHENILHWPCVLNEALVHPQASAANAGPSRRIAFVGGPFRYAGLRQFVLPALEHIAPAQLLVAAGPAAQIPGAIVLPFALNFAHFIAAWRAARPDILVHPPGQTRNLANKGPGILLTALYLGAAPIVADEPAFETLGVAQGVLRAADAKAWHAHLKALAVPAARHAYLAALLAHARSAWAPNLAAPAINALLRLAAPAGITASSRRAAAASLHWRPALRVRWRGRLRRFMFRFASQNR